MRTIDFRTRNGTQKKREGHREIFDRIGEQLGHKSMDDWYNVSVEEFSNHGGTQVLTCYKRSLSKALQTVYYEHRWLQWKFKVIPHGYWEDLNNRKHFFSWLKDQLGYKYMEDWY